MTVTLDSNRRREQSQYADAVAALRSGRVDDGIRALASLAGSAQDPELAAQCRFNIGEALYQTGQQNQAYAIWYRQAHRSASERTPADLLARVRVLQMFDMHGLVLEPPDFPPRVQVEVTNRCNLRCVMCTRNQMQRKLGNLSLEHLKKIADECSAQPGTTILLYFLGEPLLNKRLEEMVAYLASVKHQSAVPLGFGVQTNAMLLTKERARSLLDAGLREIACSVDGLEGDLERVRPGASYPVVEQNILDLLALRDELGLSDLKVEITKLCDDASADEVRRFCDRWQGRVDRVNLVHYTKVEGNLFMAADGNLLPVVPLGGAQREQRYCGQGQRLLVHADGRYAFCTSDVDGELELGHFDEQSIHEVWNGPAMQRIRDKISVADYSGQGVCERCPLSCQKDRGSRIED